jgi:hypothetical protein
MTNSNEAEKIELRPRPTQVLALSLPRDTLASLRRVAGWRDMRPEALLKLYIGQGLRQDVSRFSSARILETTAEVLARHIPSEEQRSAIIREIEGEAQIQ